MSGESEEETMTTQATDTLFLMRAMRNQTELDFRGVDLDKWVAACLLSPERRARGMAYCETLMGQLPTAEDFERVPVETPKRSAYPIDPKVYAVSDGFHPAGEWLGQWGNHNGAAYYEGLCPCNNGKGFGDCHGMEAE